MLESITDVYILYSGIDDYLAFQLPLIRKNVPNLGEIFLVQGPFGGLVPQEELHYFPGTRSLYVPQNNSFKRTKFQRIANIITYVIQEVCVFHPQKTSLFLHADCIPVDRIFAEKVLNKRVIAGRIGTNNTPISPNLCWAILNNRAASKMKRIFDYQPATTYDAKQITEEQFTKYFPESDFSQYEKIVMQYCHPGFVHLEDVSLGSDAKGALDKKVELLEENLSWLLEPITSKQ